MNATQKTWLDGMVPAAKASEEAFGVPAAVTLAQCILESGWGQTDLAQQANNFFGIKAEHRDDPNSYMEFPTAEYEHGARVMVQAEFEKYPDVEASFRDHARLLATAPRYAPAMAQKDNLAAFCTELQACGYSTAPTYAEMLKTLIVDYSLQQYD